MAPLQGTTVVELGGGIAAPYCTKWLAALGAEVIKIEPPEGDPARSWGPFPDTSPHPEQSALFLYLNTGKRSAVLDLRTDQGRERLMQLIAGADVVVGSLPPRRAEELGLTYGDLARLNPELVMTSITPFGQTGPYRDYAAEDLTLMAAGGVLHLMGYGGREPLRLGGYPANYVSGLAAFTATMMGLYVARRAGLGQQIDLSMLETMACCHNRTLIVYAYTGVIDKRGTRETRLVLPCQNGYVGLAIGARDWHQLPEFLGMPELRDDPRFRTLSLRQQHLEALEQMVLPWTRERRKEDIYNAGQQQRLTIGFWAGVEDLLASPQYRHRRYFQTIDHPVAGPLTYPGYPCHIDGRELPVRRAPLLGEHNGEFRVPGSGLRGERTAQRGTRNSEPGTGRGAALAGIRVLDFGWRWAGPLAGQHLAEMGAEVIKIESCQYPDAVRTEVRAAVFPDNTPGERSWNRSGMIHERNRNKLGLTLDLSQPRGVELFKQLVRTADVVLENFRVGVLQRFGVDYPALHQINQGLVMISLASQGTTGPESRYGSSGVTLLELGGHGSISGYSGTAPRYSMVALPDILAGMTAPGLILAALLDRDRTGVGCHIDLSQRELATHVIGEAVLEYAMKGRVQEPLGNGHPRMAPHGCYPCQGEDAWVAIAVRGDAEWAALCQEMGQPELAADPRYAESAGRLARREEVDAIVGAWTRQLTHYAVMERLQRRGIPAAPALDGRELFDDPQLVARGFYEVVTTPGTGTYPYYSRPWRFSRTPARVHRPAPGLGEHNGLVLSGLLGLGPDEIAGLEEQGVIGNEPTEHLVD